MMRLLFKAVLVTAFSLALIAQSTAQTETLPAEWDGIWKGTLAIISPDGKSQELPMELHVLAVAGSNRKTWKILYGEGARQSTRPYEIGPVAGEAGRFVVDEKNGLLIDNHLVGKTLYSQFMVTDSLVTTRFENLGDSIRVELLLFTITDPRRTKLTGRDMEVASYRFNAVQTGILKRDKAK
jgi:hypothetical protein